MPPTRTDAGSLSQTLANWRERCAWMELQAEDLEARNVRITCNGDDVTDQQARDLRRLIAILRLIIGRQDRRLR